MAERYARDILFILHTQAGMRLFGWERLPPEAIQANDIGRYSTLLDPGDLDLNSVPLGNDLIGSLAAAEQSTEEGTFTNEDLFWSTLVALEPVIGAMGGYHLYYADGKLPLLYRGKVSRVILGKRTVTVELREP